MLPAAPIENYLTGNIVQMYKLVSERQPVKTIMVWFRPVKDLCFYLLFQFPDDVFPNSGFIKGQEKFFYHGLSLGLLIFPPLMRQVFMPY